MTQTEEHIMLVLQIGGKNIGIPLWQWAMLGDFDEMEQSMFAQVEALRGQVLPVCFHIAHVPTATSGLVHLEQTIMTDQGERRIGTMDIGKTVVFGGGQRIGIIVGSDKYTFTVRLLQI